MNIKTRKKKEGGYFAKALYLSHNYLETDQIQDYQTLKK
jgi:hypothetical protein